MKRHLPLLYTLVLLAGSSCTRYYYRPNGVNTPLFTEGGQAHLNVAGSLSNFESDFNDDNFSYVFDVQGSYSPVPHLGIIANYSTYRYIPDNPDENSGHVDGKAHLLEFGVGSYYAKGKRFKMVVEGYAGYGVGRIRSDVNMNVGRFFLQPGIGVTSPVFDAAFNLRITNPKYSHFDAKGRDDDYLMDRRLINNRGLRIDQSSYFFAEPSFTVRTGYKFLKAQMQVVFAEEISPVSWEYNKARYTIGVYLILEELFKGRD